MAEKKRTITERSDASYKMRYKMEGITKAPATYKMAEKKNKKKRKKAYAEKKIGMTIDEYLK